MNINIFKTTTLSWWQVGLFKLSVAAIGIAIGAYWTEVFSPYLTHLVVVGLLSGLYIGYVWLKE